MVRLREIPRTAAFAWSPGTAKPLLVTGTRAGAVDADFSDETKLELWDLNLDGQDQGLELQPLTSLSTASRFYDIAWGPPDAEHSRGIIAGALEDGSLDLWDAEKLLAGDEDAFMSRTTKHTGAIKSLQFNPLKPQILATAGANGELFIYNITDISNPYRLGTAAARSDDLECVAWNRKVPHILATGGTGGFVTVWDLKTKKASLTLNNNRKAVSAIAWDPNNSTKLLTATPGDNEPVIFLWDLRNSNAPERTLQGHEQGVLSLSWCQQDSDLLISSGKDNRILIWNPQTGERFGEFPEVTNWTFLTRFHPSNPNLSATASFDGKISVQTLQNTNPTMTQSAAQTALDGEDFFTKAQTQPQGASFSLAKAPKWFERPVGASFGFGGKVVIFRQKPSPVGQKRSSEVQISHFSADSDIGSATEKFEAALKSGDVSSICHSHMEQATTDEEKADWRVMETLVADNPRAKVVEFLGFSGEEGVNGEAAEEVNVDHESDELAADLTGDGAGDKDQNRLSSFFADGGEGDDFLAGLTATKATKTDNPFKLFSDDESASEKRITKALMVGDFAKAAEICLKEDRMADAFMIANCGGKELVDKVQAAYLARKKGSFSYLRLLSSVVTKNLWDVVYNADLKDWKETMATICTFGNPGEFRDLCEELGDRLLASESGSRKDASFCYLVGAKLEKVVGIWIEELEEAEQAGMKESNEDSTFSVHARSLQHFIEKVTIFRHVTKFDDSEKGQSADWKLSSLYDKYTEYADIVAAHGQLAVAQRYLDLLPTHYPAAEVARNRVRLATQNTAPQQAARQVGAGRATPSRAQPSLGYQPNQLPVLPTASPMNSYAPPSLAPPVNPYAPAAAPSYGQAQAPYQPSQPAYAPPMGYGQNAYGPPPRNATPSAAPPPPRNKDAGDWNDVPMVAKAPARKTTPRVAPITSPFPNQPNLASPPPASPFGVQRTGHTPPPPPPKGPAPPRVASPLTGPPPASQHPPRPSSTAAHAYAPPPPHPGAPSGMPHVVPRVSSPYNPPPAGAPPSSRYAPNPTQQQHNAPPQQPPTASRPPPPNPYAPQAPQGGPQGQYAPSPYNANPGQVGRPPTGPPPGQFGGGPAVAQPQATPPPPPRAAPPPKAKHPAGDRSHIPTSAQRMVDIFSRDMQRVAAKAPATFAPQVKDTQSRLNILFDHLNNEELVKADTVQLLTQLAEALESKNFDIAQHLQGQIQREKEEELGKWMVGVKRLISMSKATP